jgi:hypothetical protein
MYLIMFSMVYWLAVNLKNIMYFKNNEGDR